jgi:hypothetical protein
MQTEILRRWQGLAPAAQSILILMIGSTLLLGLAWAFGNAGTHPALYYKAVVIKGLLPQLGLTLAFMPLLRRFRVRRAGPAHTREAANPGAGSLFLECLIMSALAYSAVVPFLLTLELPGWPALRMVDPSQRIGNFLAMTLGVALLAWWPLWQKKSARESDTRSGKGSA